jgi:hypothetical protein
MRTSFAPPTHGHADHDRLDGTAISLAQVLSVVEAVGEQFRHAAPSKAAATLVQSALWLVAAKLEALETPARPPVWPPANHEPSATCPPVQAAPVSEPMVPTSPPAGDARDGADATPSDAHSSRQAQSTRASSPVPQGAPLRGHCGQTAPPKAIPELETPAPVPERAQAHAVAPVSRTTRVGIADQARPTTSTTVNGRAHAVADKASAPPDAYDGLCAVGARLFAAAAVTA